MLISITLIERTVPGFTGLTDAISKAFSAQITTSTIDLPITRSYDAEGKRFDAELFLKELRPFRPGADIGIFIFREDLYVKGKDFVFGHAAGADCIVSTYRLDPRLYGETDLPKAGALFRKRLLAQAIYHAAKCIGLEDCPDKACPMAPALSLGELDSRGGDFCPRCSRELGLKIQSRKHSPKGP
ncbi:MAG: archaemetzincin [Candidatus Micrarchaeia archaeon]